MTPVHSLGSKALISAQVCDAADIKADDPGNASLPWGSSLVEIISDEELETLKILSGGIAIMMVCVCACVRACVHARGCTRCTRL